MELVFKGTGLLLHFCLQLIDLTRPHGQAAIFSRPVTDLSLGKGVVLLKLARFLCSCLLEVCPYSHYQPLHQKAAAARSLQLGL